MSGRHPGAPKGTISEPCRDAAEWRRAVIYGSVMGSFCCERFGVDRFRDLTQSEIEKRYQEFKTCTAF